MTSNLIFEIGTEEIPSAALYRATDQLKELACKALDAAGLAHGEVKTCSTPRRMILSVADLATSTKAVEIKSKGPSAKIAFDADGNPTKAASGFARGKGLDVSDLLRECDENGDEYVYAVVSKPAQEAKELLTGILENLVRSLSWPRSQRWGTGRDTFSRPVRWLVALLGADVVDVQFAGLHAGRTTYGHRFLAPEPVEVASADEFFSHFEAMKVIPSAQERAASIKEQVARVEEELGLKADMPKGTFDEVVNLVEYPTVIVAHFDEEFLQVPPEIITDAMLEHQRYFPMYRADGQLDNAFIVTGNGDPACTDTIRDGNERVVRARLSDAAFFVREDRAKPLADYVEGLKAVVFQEKLGTVYDKTQRICDLASAVCTQAAIDSKEQTAKDALRAAYLCKADLITGAVVEFTSLQGVMGGHYARYSGETEDVAVAVREHYRPRFSGDDVPSNIAGKIVALSDKMDTICGIFAAGMGPTGSSDPYALRRAALGILSILQSGLDVCIEPLVHASLDAYASQGVAFDVKEVTDQVLDFFITRTKVMLKDAGKSQDAIDAVLAAGIVEPMELVARVDALEAARSNDAQSFADLAVAFARANNLRDASEGCDYDESSLSDTQASLSSAIKEARCSVDAALSKDDYASALASLAALRAPIDEFFDKVMVKDEDLAVRSANMKLLNSFVSVFSNVADISKLAAK